TLGPGPQAPPQAPGPQSGGPESRPAAGIPSRVRNLLSLAALAATSVHFAACATTGAPHAAPAEQPELAQQAEIRRTTYGVPQIRADNLRSGAFALAYVQMEDYGERVVDGLQSARGQMALV